MAVGSRSRTRSEAGNGQLPVSHPFHADERVGDAADVGRLAADDNNLETVVVVEVDVKRGQHRVVMFVLGGRQLLAQQPDVVRVDQRDGPDDPRVGSRRQFFDEGVPDQVAERFRPAGIASPRNQLVELAQKLRVDCHADAAQVVHAERVASML